MPHNYTRTDQVKFLTEWFDSWSEMQKEDFLPIMVQTLNPADHVNGLVGGANTLVIGERRPSLFDCQVKLFQDWYENWTPSEKERLQQHFDQADPDFASKLKKSLTSQSSGDDVQTPSDIIGESPVHNLVAIPNEPSTEEEENKDDGVSPGSHSSSPLSSLSQPLSPHDSGLEENPSDNEMASVDHNPTSTMSNGTEKKENSNPVDKDETPETGSPSKKCQEEGPSAVTEEIQESI